MPNPKSSIIYAVTLLRHGTDIVRVKNISPYCATGYKSCKIHAGDKEIEMVDITYASDKKESNFVAETPAGEKFLGGPELTVPTDEAEAYLEQARAAGLTILPFP